MWLVRFIDYIFGGWRTRWRNWRIVFRVLVRVRVVRVVRVVSAKLVSAKISSGVGVCSKFCVMVLLLRRRGSG